MAFFVNKELALRALEALSPQSPNSVMAVSTKGPLKQKKGCISHIIVTEVAAGAFTFEVAEVAFEFSRAAHFWRVDDVNKAAVKR